MRGTNVAIGVALAAIGGFVLGYFAAARGPDPAGAPSTTGQEVQGPPPNEQYRVIAGRSPQKGPDGALVTIVEFVDYEAEGMAEAQRVLDRVIERYGDAVRLIIKYNPDPQHLSALAATEAALAAHAQGKHWQMHKRLLASPDRLARADLEGHAKAIGLDMAKFRTDLDRHEHARSIQVDSRTAARFGIRGSPVFFVNGYPLVGAQDFEGFTRLVDRELPKARRLLKTGVPAERLYAHLVRDAKRTNRDRRAEGPERERFARAQQVEQSNVVYKVPIDGAPVRGPATALVTIVEYVDFQ